MTRAKESFEKRCKIKGANLQRQRLEKKHTQDDLADLIGGKKQQISKIENDDENKRTLTESQREILAKELDCTADYLSGNAPTSQLLCVTKKHIALYRKDIINYINTNYTDIELLKPLIDYLFKCVNSKNNSPNKTTNNSLTPDDYEQLVENLDDSQTKQAYQIVKDLNKDTYKTSLHLCMQSVERLDDEEKQLLQCFVSYQLDLMEKQKLKSSNIKHTPRDYKNLTDYIHKLDFQYLSPLFGIIQNINYSRLIDIKCELPVFFLPRFS